MTIEIIETINKDINNRFFEDHPWERNYFSEVRDAINRYPAKPV